MTSWTIGRVVQRPSRPASFPLATLGIAVALLAGCVSNGDDGAGDEAVPAPPDPAILAFYQPLLSARAVTFETDHGTIRFLLYDPFMPMTTARIGELVETDFYDGTIVHRVVDDFVIQGGDPSRTGSLGSGETIAFESHPDLLFLSGAVGLARDTDPDSGDSQWFITEKPALHLSDPESDTAAVFGTYALFGQVFEGMEVVRAIATVQTLPGLDRPIVDVVLQDAEIGPLPPGVDLLALPRSDGNLTTQPADWILERPLHLFALHPFTLRVFVDPASGAAPVSALATFTELDPRGSTREHVNVTLLPRADDAFVLEAGAVLPHGGRWESRMDAAGDAGYEVVDVVAWHDAYARFAGGGGASVGP